MVFSYFIMSVEERKAISLFGDDYCKFLRHKKPLSFSITCLFEGIKALFIMKTSHNIFINPIHK